MPVSDPASDVWLPRLRLAFEFVLTMTVLVGAFLLATSGVTSAMADSGAAALATLVVGYWFSRALAPR